MRLSNIALYDKNTTDFFDQGLGILSDAISSESTEEVQDNGNITYEMVLKYPIGGVLSDQLKLPNLIRAQESEDPNDFMIFEIYDYDEDDEGEMTVYAQAMPYRVLRLPFNDDSKFPTKYNNIQELMDYAVSRVTGFPSWFKITSDIIVANNLSFDAGNAQFENLGKFLDATLSLIDASVEYKWNRINILDSRGRDLSDIVLRDDKNTNGIKITGSYEKIINKVVPIIRNRNEKTGEFEDGTHMGSVVTSKDPFKWIPYYAGVTASFDSQEEANNYISSNKLDNPAITVDVTPLMVDEDLTQVHTFDRITAYSTKLKYQDTLQVTTRVFDQLNAEVVSFKMGSIKKDINSTTSYTLSSLASEIARAQNIASGAARSADGKNTNYYTEATPVNQIEGDLWFHKIDGKDVIQQYINGEWSTIVKDGMGGEIRSYVDQKILENNDAMDKLHSDLESNSQTIKDNKQAVDDAMIKVNEDLTKAKADAESAFQKSDDAVGKAQSAVNASGLATNTANAAHDAAMAAKELATSTANSFVTVKSQADTAFDKAKSALEAANGASSTATKASQDVDTINGTIKTLATTETVNSIKGEVDKATTDIETIGGQMKQVYTKTETTNLLTPYATQTWAQNQINVTAQGWETQLSSVQAQYDNISISARNLLYNTSAFTKTEPWASAYGGATIALTRHNFWKNGTERMLALVATVGKTEAHMMSNRFDLEPNSTYTFQLKAFHDAGVKNVRFYLLSSAYADNDTGAEYNRSTGVHLIADSVTFSYAHYVAKSWQVKTGATDQTGYIRVDINTADDNKNHTLFMTQLALKKESILSDYTPAQEDTATYTDTKVADLKYTVDGLTGTFAKKSDLESTNSKLKVASDGLDFVTAVTGKKGENVTQVIADVKKIQTTMTGANGYTTRLQTLEGFQTTASGQIAGKAEQTQVTQLADQYNIISGSISNPNLVLNSGLPTDTSSWLDASNLSIRKHSFYRDNRANVFCINNATTAEKTASTNRFKVTPGQSYTVSFKAFAGSNSASQDVFFLGRSASSTASRGYDKVMLLVDVHRYSPSGIESAKVTFTVPEGIDEGYLRFDNNGSTDGNNSVFFFTEIKCEFGSLATPWEGESDYSQLLLLKDQLDLRVTVSNKVTAALSLSADGGGTVTIRGASLYVTAASHFDDASIQSAAIASLDAKKITSGSISSDRLATTKLNADNITSGSISSDRLATTKLNADNITSGSINADLITTGTLSADRIWGGTLNGYLMDIVNINANNITTGTISGANLAINLTTGDVKFQSGRIHDKVNRVDINIDPSGLNSYLSVANGDNRVLLKGGELQFIQPNLFNLQKTPYLSISNQGSGSNWAGATFVGRDSVVVANSANTGGSIIDWGLGQTSFAGLMAGKNSDGTWDPTIVGGADRGVVITGGPLDDGKVQSSPFIRVGASTDGYSVGNRIYMHASYIIAPSIYTKTTGSSSNVVVLNDGSLHRSTSASKYKTMIERSRSTSMAEALLSLPTAHWLDKAEINRYSNSEQKQPPKQYFGMIAEDLAGAGLEELVQRGDDGELEGINYDRIAPALLPLLAKMKQEIEELKGE